MVLVVLLAAVPFFLAASFSAIIVYRASATILQREIESSTAILHNLIDSLLKNSVRSYLRAKIETGEELIERQLRTDGLTEETEESLVSTFRSLSVGGDGYYYALTPEGEVVFHPDTSIIGELFQDREPVKDQIVMRDGYLEYMWQNTDEVEPRNKALYMAYIPELQWILSATSYRDQFTYMVELEALRETVSSVSIGPGGYSYVVKRDGTFIAHPYLSGDDPEGRISDAEFRAILDRFFSAEEGVTTYLWRDSMEESKREKLVSFKYLPDFDWVVGTAFYRDEISRPIKLMVYINVALAFLVALLLSFLIFRLHAAIEGYLLHISSVLEANSRGDLLARASREGPREVVELADRLNQFLQELEEKTGMLSESLEEKERLLREIQHRVKNNLQTILSLLSLQKNRISSQDGLQLLEKTRNSISSMSIVYEYLSESREQLITDTVSMSRYLEDFIQPVVFNHPSNAVRVETSFEDIWLLRDQAIYCGLLLNELISSVADSASEVRLFLIREDEGCLLLIQENRGLFASLASPEKSRKRMSDEEKNDFDRELISVLVSQLRGLMKVSTDSSGSTVEVRFPVSGGSL